MKRTPFFPAWVVELVKIPGLRLHLVLCSGSNVLNATIHPLGHPIFRFLINSLNDNLNCQFTVELKLHQLHYL